MYSKSGFYFVVFCALMVSFDAQADSYQLVQINDTLYFSLWRKLFHFIVISIKLVLFFQDKNKFIQIFIFELSISVPFGSFPNLPIVIKTELPTKPGDKMKSTRILK